MNRTVTSNVAIRVSDAKARKLVRDTKASAKITGKYFHVRSLVADEFGEYVGNAKSYICIEVDQPVVLTYLQWDPSSNKNIQHSVDCNSMFMLYGDLNSIFVKAKDAKFPANVNVYISTDDEVQSFFDAYVDTITRLRQQRPLRLKVAATQPPAGTESDKLLPYYSLPIIKGGLLQGVKYADQGIPLTLESGINTHLLVHTTT